MSESLRKYIVSGATEIKAAEASGYPCVHLIYKISQSGILQRIPTFVSPRRNLMGVYDDDGLKTCDIDKLTRDITNEINRRNYSGIVLDFQPDKTDPGQTEKLCTLLAQRKILHFLPIELAQLSNSAKIIVPTSVSGGSIHEMLMTTIEKYTSERVCIEIVRGRNDFIMPSYKPEGTFINNTDFNKIIKEHDPITFFSSQLGCKYFTYRTSDCTHFVLYDDTDTAIYKLKLSESLGIYAVFIMYSEWGESSRLIVNAK